MTNSVINSQKYSDSEVLSFIAKSRMGGIFQARISEGFPLLYANEYYYSLHGYTKEEFELKFYNMAERVVVEQDIGAVSEQIRQAIDDKVESVTLEYRIYKKDGSISWLHASAGFTKTVNGVLMSGMVINIDKRKNFEEQLLLSEKRFRVALEHTQVNVWEYDFKTRSIIMSGEPFEFFGKSSVICDVPSSQIRQQIIHPDDADKYSALYAALHDGAKTACAVIRIRSSDGKYCWEKINYTNIFDNNGIPVRAVAVSEDITPQKEAEQRCFQEEHLREMLSADMLLSAKINFSCDRIVHIWSDDYDSNELQHICNYKQLTEHILKCIVNRTDKKRFICQFSDALQNFDEESDNSSFYGEYRCCISSGRILWCAFRMAVMRDPVTSEQVGFLYIRDIDERKKIELALQYRAERDALTGLYNRQTAESMINQCLQRNKNSDALCALFIIDMDGFKQVNDRYGHYTGDRILEDVGRILLEDADGRSISGRLGGDEFIVFADKISDENIARKLAGRICEKLKICHVYDDKTLYVSASVGLVVSSCKSADFKIMFQQADSALYYTKSHGKASYSIYGDYDRQECDICVTEDSCIARGHLGERCMLDQIDNSVLVIDEQSHDVLFMNRIARDVFCAGDYRGKKCYNILHGFSEPCVFCQSHVPGEDGFKTWENLNTLLHRRFMIRDRIVNWDGRRARLEIFTDLSEYERRLNSKYKAERVLLDCASLLLVTNPLETAIQGVLEHLGGFYKADRAYFAKTQDMQSIVISPKDWRAHGIAVAEDENNLIEHSLLDLWLNSLSRTRVALFLSLDEMRELFPVKYSVLKARNVESFAAVALMDENGMVGYIGLENPRENLDNTTLLKSLSYFMHNEITKRRLQEQQIFDTEHNSTTGLLNWKSFMKRFSRIEPESLSSIGVLAADIFNLRLINQEYGCDYGDRLIKLLADGIKDNFPGDLAFHFSADEFVVLCQDITYETFTERIANVQRRMDEEHPGSVILGYSWSDTDIMPDHLINCAQERLELMKARQRDAQSSDLRLREIRLQRLLDAMKARNFRVYLQPKADIASGKIVGAEALIRYSDRKHKLVPPIKFIPQIEAENNIRYIDFFVLNEVCAAIASWKKRGFPLMAVSLNFSRRTFMENNLTDKMNAVVDRFGIEHSLLEIEITESTGDIERRALSEIGRQLTASGYKLYLDDFGSEYSNIATLTSLPISGLKFDKSLINDLYSNSKAGVLIKNLLNVCNEMGIDSIAEGVEEPEQLEILKSLGCTLAQGYLFNKPIPIRDFERKYLEAPLRTIMN